MKKARAEIVGRSAVDKLMDWLEGYAKSLAGCTLGVAGCSGGGG